MHSAGEDKLVVDEPSGLAEGGMAFVLFER
jgi:hypothetical protein